MSGTIPVRGHEVEGIQRGPGNIRCSIYHVNISIPCKTDVKKMLPFQYIENNEKYSLLNIHTVYQ